MRAGLAQLDPDALDVADPEAFADERVQVDAACEHVPPARLGAELDPALVVERAQGFLGDEGERVPGRRLAVRPVVAVAGEALAGMCLDAVDGLRQLTLRTDVDGDHLTHRGRA
jgi:hypothetical protein